MALMRQRDRRFYLSRSKCCMTPHPSRLTPRHLPLRGEGFVCAVFLDLYTLQTSLCNGNPPVKGNVCKRTKGCSPAGRAGAEWRLMRQRDRRSCLSRSKRCMTPHPSRLTPRHLPLRGEGFNGQCKFLLPSLRFFTFTPHAFQKTGETIRMDGLPSACRKSIFPDSLYKERPGL